MIFFNIKGWVSSLLSILVFFQIVLLSRFFFSKRSQVNFRHSIKSFPVSKFYGMTFYFKPFNYCQICKETHSNRNNLIEKAIYTFAAMFAELQNSIFQSILQLISCHLQTHNESANTKYQILKTLTEIRINIDT